MHYSHWPQIYGNRCSERGTTLIELLVVVLIVFVMVSQAAPSLVHLVTAVRIRSTAQEFYAHLQLARSEAIKRNSRTALCPSADGKQGLPGGRWEQGWVVFYDANDNAQVDTTDAIIATHSALSEPLRFGGNTNVAKYVYFAGDGSNKLMGGAFQAGHFTICASSKVSTQAKLIYISKVGHTRIATATVEQC